MYAGWPQIRKLLQCKNSHNSLEAVIRCAIAVHSLDDATDPVGSTTVITGNTRDACQGHKGSRAKNLTIAHNVLPRTLRNPIVVDLPYTGVEGNSPMLISTSA